MTPRLFGIIACTVGLVGVLSTVLGHHVIERPPEQVPGWEVKVNLSEKLHWRYGTNPSATPQPTSMFSRDSFITAGIVIGCVAITVAVISWIRREGIALGLIGLFLGVAAIAWEQVVIIFVAFFITGGPAIWFSGAKAEKADLSITKDHGDAQN